jgi:hypothetical protein
MEAAIPPAREIVASDVRAEALLIREPAEDVCDPLKQVEEPADVVLKMVVRSREFSSAVDPPHRSRRRDTTSPARQDGIAFTDYSAGVKPVARVNASGSRHSPTKRNVACFRRGRRPPTSASTQELRVRLPAFDRLCSFRSIG